MSTHIGLRPIARSAVKSDMSSSDMVVEYVIQGILAGRIVPQQRLVESDLTLSVGVSRGPIREAFRRLDALGILSREMHRGARVRTLTPQEAVDLLAAVEPLAGLIAQLAARAVLAGTRSQIAQIERLLRPYRDEEEDWDNLLTQRRNFYETLIEIGGNRELFHILPTMRIHLLRLQFRYLLEKEQRKRHLKDYGEISRAVLNGNERQASNFICRHLGAIRTAILKSPDLAIAS